MKLARFFASVLAFIIVLYIGFSSISRVFAVPCGQEVVAAHDCECYFPNTGEYGVICGAECLQMDCTPPDNQVEISIAK